MFVASSTSTGRGAAASRHLERLHLQLFDAHGLEGVVDAAAASERLDLLHRVTGVGVDFVGCAEPAGRLALHLHGVDGNDARRAADARALDR